MANFTKDTAAVYAIQQRSEGDCWQRALAMAINLNKKRILVNLDYMRQATSTFAKTRNDWAQEGTWRTVANQVTDRYSLRFSYQTLTDFAMDSTNLAIKIARALDGCSVIILSLHNGNGEFHDVVVAGYQNVDGLSTNLVVLDPAKGNATEVSLGELWKRGIKWVCGIDSLGG